MSPGRSCWNSFERALLTLCGTICVLVFVLSEVGPSQAQTSAASARDLLTYFYEDPRPERLIGYLESIEQLPEFQDWRAYPPVAGSFAVIFADHPDWIEKLFPDRAGPKVVETLVAALRLSGNASRESQFRARAGGGSDAELKLQFTDLPARLDDLAIVVPTHLDILWGASFASGDGRYARMIIDFFAETANRSEDIAIDVAKVAIVMAGGPDEVLTTLRGKHGDALTTEIIYAAAALWALHSNAEQHDFIDKIARDYLAEVPDTPARRAISAIWQIP